jgi:hypothetical protein
MSKFTLLLLLSALFGFSCLELSAAPARPVDKVAKKKELESLWTKLYEDEPASTTAAIKLFKQPEHAVPFLQEKLRPLKLEAVQCRKLLAELGSNDEKTWKAAWEALDYLDPRLAIDLPTLMNEVTTNPSRTRMVELCSDRDADSLSGQDVQIRPVGDDGYNFFSKGSWWAEHKIERIGKYRWNPKKSWTRAARGIAVLEQIGSPEARKVIEQMATGHPDAFPTKAAKESLKRMKK